MIGYLSNSSASCIVLDMQMPYIFTLIIIFSLSFGTLSWICVRFWAKL